MRRNGAIAIGVVAALAISWAICWRADAAERTIRQQRKSSMRPNADDGPTEVKVGFYLLDIAEVNDAEQSFTADVFVSLEWKDPRLTGKGFRYLKPEEMIWYPEALLRNRRDVVSRFEDTVMVTPDGTALYTQRFYGSFSFPMNLRDFPFDKHRIPIQIISAGEGPDEVAFSVDENVTGRDKEFSLAGWIVEDVDFTLDTYLFEPSNSEFSMLTFALDAHRGVSFYIWRIMLPLTLIVFMSWMVFWIDPSHLEAQVGISATSILTLIAFQFTVGVLLPRLAYLTRMDYFVFFSSLLVFLALVEGVTTSALASKGKKEMALTFDAWSRFLFPSAFVAAILISFVF